MTYFVIEKCLTADGLRPPGPVARTSKAKLPALRFLYDFGDLHGRNLAFACLRATNAHS